MHLEHGYLMLTHPQYSYCKMTVWPYNVCVEWVITRAEGATKYPGDADAHHDGQTDGAVPIFF
jgi:hypothetical protein